MLFDRTSLNSFFFSLESLYCTIFNWKLKFYNWYCSTVSNWCHSYGNWPCTILGLYLYNCESKYVANLIRTNKLRGTGFHSTFWFIEDLCALGYGGEFSETFVEINPIKLELKVEYNGSHATFLHLDNSIDKGEFIYKKFDN